MQQVLPGAHRWPLRVAKAVTTHRRKPQMLIIHAHPRPSQSRVVKQLLGVLAAQPGAELRSLYSDMPMLIACADGLAEMSRKFAADRCTGVLPKPYTAAKLAQALRDLGLRCAAASRTG